MGLFRLDVARAQTVTTWLLAAAALLGVAPLQAADAPRAGKTLIGRHDLPQELVARMATLKPSEPAPGESKLTHAQLADAIEWIGPELDAVPKGNPYVLAVRVKGRARADGDVATLWKTGWNVGDGNRSNVLPGLSRSQMKAGQAFEARAVGTPLSFKDPRKIVPVVGIVSASNLDIASVQVEVWSGLASPGWRDLLFSLQGALVGVVMIGLLWWWRR